MLFLLAGLNEPEGKMQDLRTLSQQVKAEAEPRFFLIWIAVWIVALAVLLPTLG